MLHWIPAFAGMTYSTKPFQLTITFEIKIMQDSEQDINRNNTKTISSIEIEDKKPAKLSFIEYLISIPKCDELDIQRVEGKAREIEF